VEDGSDAKRRAHSLGQKNLIVLGGNRGHHQAEDMKEAANKNEVTGSKIIKNGPNNRTLESQQRVAQ